MASLLFFVGVNFVAADQINCTVAQSNPNPVRYDKVDNVTTQGHYSGGTVYSMYCSSKWYKDEGNTSFRYVDGGHVQPPANDTFPEDQRLGSAVKDCRYDKSGACNGDMEVCVFRMSNADNAHVADCSNSSAPIANSYDGQLCCEIREVCTDGMDNDGDAYVDCADPECNQEDPGDSLDPADGSSPKVCRKPGCPTTLHQDLQAFWQFENNTRDSSGNKRHGSANDDPGYVKGIYGHHRAAMNFSDKNDYVTIPYDNDAYIDRVLNETRYAYTFWLKPTKPSTGEFRTIFRRENNDRYPGVWLHQNNMKLHIDHTTGSNDWFNTNGELPVDEWTHVTIEVNGDDKYVEVYFNGKLDRNYTQSGTPNQPSKTALRIGQGKDNHSQGGHGFTLDQVRVYNRTLTTDEIQSFTNSSCNNRQRTIECINSPELCNVSSYKNFSGDKPDRYHCDYGTYDRPSRGRKKGICCPPNTVASKDPFTGEWSCTGTDECGLGGLNEKCDYNISKNEKAFFNATYEGSSDSKWCVSQIPKLEDNPDQPSPTKSSACCYVPKQGELGWWFKDGNVKVYG